MVATRYCTVRMIDRSADLFARTASPIFIAIATPDCEASRRHAITVPRTTFGGSSSIRLSRAAFKNALIVVNLPFTSRLVLYSPLRSSPLALHFNLALHGRRKRDSPLSRSK